MRPITSPRAKGHARTVLPTSWLQRVLLAASFTLATASPAWAEPVFEPCHLSGSGGNGSLRAHCSTWKRPLDPGHPDGRQIELRVAKLPSTAVEPAQDALTIINGGPGASSVELLVDLAPILGSFTRERDVIVIDQRGTGLSAPLKCDALTNAPQDMGHDEVIQATHDCLDQLPYDPRFFSTSVAVDDLEALRKSLEYEQWSVYGVSYGTRVAMQYMRTYPGAIRTAVIDGVVPAQMNLGSNVALNSQATLNSLFARCAVDGACAEHFGNLRDDFARLSERLRRQSIPLTLQHPVTGVPTELELTYEHLAIWIRLALYAPETAALVPLIIDQAANKRNYLPVAAGALRMLHQLSSSLNYGMHNAVVCTEDAPFYDEKPANISTQDSTYLGREMYETLQAICSTWPAGIIDEHLKKPLRSGIPTLVLSGEFDPITPPDYGEAVMAGLTNARHLIVPGQGHGTLSRGCISRLVLEFVESGNVDELDGACMQHLTTYPFFVDLMGPLP